MIKNNRVTSDELSIILDFATVDISGAIRLLNSSRCELHTKNVLVHAFNESKEIGLSSAIESIHFDTKELELVYLVAKHLEIVK
jgi:hypothetical protein